MEEFARQFGIDAKLLVSQAVNFFLLLLLLRVFAYKPILAMLQERKERIERGLHMAREAEEKLRRADANASEKMKEAERQSVALLEAGEKEARERGAVLLAEAERKKERLMNDAKMLLLGEEEKMREKFGREVKVLLRAALERAVGASPEKIDEALVMRAAEEMGRV
ncbi:MAG: hypothetical protein AAB846_00695 [Patescibacteria group bacterium]